jgi:hypothetical protein
MPTRAGVCKMIKVKMGYPDTVFPFKEQGRDFVMKCADDIDNFIEDRAKMWDSVFRKDMNSVPHLIFLVHFTGIMRMMATLKDFEKVEKLNPVISRLKTTIVLQMAHFVETFANDVDEDAKVHLKKFLEKI